MNFIDLVRKLKEYATKTIGRLKAYQLFMEKALVEGVSTASSREPLGDRLGFARMTLNENAIMKEARKEINKKRKEGAPLLIPTWDQLVPHILSHAWTEAPNYKIDPAHITEHTLMGKDDQAWVELPTSRKFDIGDHDWRVVDWLRPPVGSGWSNLVSSFELLDKKEALGDGVVGVVTGASLGLAHDTLDHFQVRVTVTDPITNTIVSVAKGIVMVHPDAANVLAAKDFYGQDLEAKHVITFYDMAQGSRLNPRARYTLQGLYYQGVKMWHNFLFAVDNFRVSGDEDALITEEKLVSANAPVHALGGFGLIAVMTRLMRLTVTSGHSRMLLPAKAFRYIKDLEHVTQIEQVVADESDEHKRDRIVDHDGQVPFYFAPEALKPYYERFRNPTTGCIRRLLNRRPDLSTGQCTREFELADYLPFNAYVIPSWGLTIAGADFDGDLAVDFPTIEQGGLYVAFNRRKLEDRTARLQAATSDRKQVTLEDGTVVASSKQNYPSRLARMAGQWEAKIVLGMSDVAARRLLDRADSLEAEGNHEGAQAKRELAYSLQAWTQASVDRQKRPVPWPNPKGTQLMPHAYQADDEVFLVDLLRTVSKGDVNDEFEVEDEHELDLMHTPTPYAKAWSKLTTKLQAIKHLHNVLALGKDNPYTVVGDSQRVRTAARWASEIHQRFTALLSEVPIIRSTGRPAPFEVNFPDRLTAEAPDPDSPACYMQERAQLIDYHWRKLMMAGGSIRAGAFNFKDGMRDAAKSLGTSEDVALVCRDFALFREFASVAQLDDYFTNIPGKRLSDYFPVVSGRDFAPALDTSGKVNVNPVQVGFTSFAPGELLLEKYDFERYRITAKRQAYIVPACTPNDAMVQLAGALIDDFEPLIMALFSQNKAPIKPVPPVVPGDLASLRAAMAATIANHGSSQAVKTPASNASDASIDPAHLAKLRADMAATLQGA